MKRSKQRILATITLTRSAFSVSLLSATCPHERGFQLFNLVTLAFVLLSVINIVMHHGRIFSGLVECIVVNTKHLGSLVCLSQSIFLSTQQNWTLHIKTVVGSSKDGYVEYSGFTPQMLHTSEPQFIPLTSNITQHLRQRNASTFVNENRETLLYFQ